MVKMNLWVGAKARLKIYGFIAEIPYKKQQHKSFDQCLWDWKIRIKQIDTIENWENLNLCFKSNFEKSKYMLCICASNLQQQGFEQLSSNSLRKSNLLRKVDFLLKIGFQVIVFFTPLEVGYLFVTVGFCLQMSPAIIFGTSQNNI